ncbi:MAG: EamA family transporter [Janthinobacterium lividum]
MNPGRIALVALALAAFAGNSLLCRMALRTTVIDPASFTAIRLLSGALALCAIILARRQRPGGTWVSAAALFAYAIAFSYAYAGLPAGTGALLLFGAVQATMLGHAVRSGARLAPVQLLGLVLAAAGLVALLLPGLAAPSPPHAGLMLAAGFAWGVYSLRGRAPGDPTAATAGNFLRAVPFAALPLLASPLAAPLAIDPAGMLYAVLSGAIASGLGYAIWYAALRGLTAATAATVQLAVPLLAALAAVPLLDEPFTLRLLLSAAAILGGIALVIRTPARLSVLPRRPLANDVSIDISAGFPKTGHPPPETPTVTSPAPPAGPARP